MITRGVVVTLGMMESFQGAWPRKLGVSNAIPHQQLWVLVSQMQRLKCLLWIQRGDREGKGRVPVHRRYPGKGGTVELVVGGFERTGVRNWGEAWGGGAGQSSWPSRCPGVSTPCPSPTASRQSCLSGS